MKSQLILALSVLTLWSCNSPKPEETVKTETPAVAVAQRPVEFADEKYNNFCKEGMQKLAAGDVDGFLAAYSEDAKYRWNNGDSLVGKPAITKYWKERRGSVITKLEFTNDIWLPLTVTEANTEQVRKGTWVLAWYTTHATYKGGKSIVQSMHMLFHFNNEDKIDEVIHYLDRGPIVAAVGK
jgi:ketosteroid isomerase-like protein